METKWRNGDIVQPVLNPGESARRPAPGPPRGARAPSGPLPATTANPDGGAAPSVALRAWRVCSRPAAQAGARLLTETRLCWGVPKFPQEHACDAISTLQKTDLRVAAASPESLAGPPTQPSPWRTDRPHGQESCAGCAACL